MSNLSCLNKVNQRSAKIKKLTVSVSLIALKNEAISIAFDMCSDDFESIYELSKMFG